MTVVIDWRQRITSAGFVGHISNGDNDRVAVVFSNLNTRVSCCAGTTTNRLVACDMSPRRISYVATENEDA